LQCHVEEAIGDRRGLRRRRSVRDEGVGDRRLGRDIGLFERRQVLGEVGAADLGALGFHRGRERNPDRAGNVAEHHVKRAGIGVGRARQGGIGDRTIGDEQESQAKSLCAAHQGEGVVIGVRGQVVGIGEGAAEREEPESDEEPGLHVRQEPADDRDQEQDQDRARGEDEAGVGRGIAELLLRELRDQDRARIKNGADHENHHRAEREIAIAENAEIDHRVLGDGQPHRRPDQPDRGEKAEGADHRVGEPVIVLAAIEHDLETADAERDQRDADIIDAAAAPALGLHPGRILDQRADRQKGDDADRHVDQEHPAPGVIIGDPAAQSRPDDGREDGRDGDHRKGAPALRGLEGIENDRLLIGLQAAAEKPLHQPEDDDLRERGRNAAKEGADREGGDADHEIALAPDHPPEPAGNRQDDAVGDEIGGERPGGVVIARRHRAGDVRQADIDDGGVDDLHERRHGDDDRDRPRVGARAPGGVTGGGRAHGLSLFRAKQKQKKESSFSEEKEAKRLFSGFPGADSAAGTAQRVKKFFFIKKNNFPPSLVKSRRRAPWRGISPLAGRTAPPG